MSSPVPGAFQYLPKHPLGCQRPLREQPCRVTEEKLDGAPPVRDSSLCPPESWQRFPPVVTERDSPHILGRRSSTVMKRSEFLRQFSSLQALLESQSVREAVERAGRNPILGSLRTLLEDVRRDLARRSENMPSLGELAHGMAQGLTPSWAARWLPSEEPELRPVINASGTLLPQALGGCPLAEEAADAVKALSREYVSGQFSLPRGSSHAHQDGLAELACELTGAEAALVLGSSSAAAWLTLKALATGREAIIARSELITIDGVGVPFLAEEAGVRLREVGTTNVTHAADFAAAVSAETACLLRVRAENFEIVGTTQFPSLSELAAVARKAERPLVVQLGSALPIDVPVPALAGQLTAAAAIRAGADLVLLGGDKLLGGPECGILLGRRQLVRRVAEHPLAKMLHTNLLTRVALWETLRLYRDPQEACRRIPVLSLLDTPLENLHQRAVRLATQLERLPGVAQATAVATSSDLLGHQIPSAQLQTWVVALAPVAGTAEDLAKSLRNGTPAVIGRVQKEQLILDLRSIFPRQDQAVIEALQALFPVAGTETTRCE